MNRSLTLLSLCAAASLSWPHFSHGAQPDIVIADFEGPTYGNWKTDGNAFGTGPSAALPDQMPVDGFEGKSFANSFHNHDRGTGRLTSPTFTINRKFMKFLIGGGGWEGKTCMNLLVGDKVVRSATGPNTKPGGHETLAPAVWEVGQFEGQQARIEIVDEATGGWGHINVDQIVLTDAPPPRLLTNFQRELKLDHPLLNLPVKTGAPRRHLKIFVDGQVVRELDLELAEGEPQFWVFTDVTPWLGKTATLEVNRYPENSTGLAQVVTDDKIKGSEDLYHEALRPQAHFTTQRGWINDPNGLSWYRGEYHMFYQLSPFTWGGSAKYWGHAVSKDLVHWEELPLALEPDALGQMFSGGAVLDALDSSKLGKDGQAPLVLIYTAAGSWGQCLASTTDGRTITKYAKNPVLQQITPGNRDPHVFWHNASAQWILVLYVGHPIPGEKDAQGKPAHRDTVQFFSSKNLKDWTPLSEVEGYYECPDMFELPLDGNEANRKWVLTAANSDYQVGTFDGTKFTPETPEKVKGQRGNGMYAAQTFANMPDGRRVQIGWGTTPAPGMPFNQQMNFPCELTLHTTPEGPRMFWQPVKELAQLRGEWTTLPAQALAPDANPLHYTGEGPVEIEAEIEPGSAAQVGFTVRGTDVTYDAKKGELICLGKTAPLPLKDGAIRLHLLVDKLSIEIFGDDGLVYMPIGDHAKTQDLGLAAFAREGTAQLRSLRLNPLKSIWPPLSSK